MNLKLGTSEQLSILVANSLAGVFVNGTSLSAALSAKADLTALQNYLTAETEPAFSEMSGNFLTAHQSLSNYYKKSETSSASLISIAILNAGNNNVMKLSSSTPLTVDLGNDATVVFGDGYIDVQGQDNGINFGAGTFNAFNDGAYLQIVDNSSYIEVPDYNCIKLANGTTLSAALAGKQPVGNYLTSHLSLSNYYKKSETSSASLISIALQNAGSKVYFDNHLSGISGSNDLSIIKLSADEYALMLDEGTCLSNAIYLVEAPVLDAFGQRIANVAPGIELSDAANLQLVSAICEQYIGNANSLLEELV